MQRLKFEIKAITNYSLVQYRRYSCGMQEYKHETVYSWDGVWVRWRFAGGLFSCIDADVLMAGEKKYAAIES